jgi:hypothetical protein
MKTIVLVIDALDECDRDADIPLIIGLLPQTRLLRSVRLRAFVTSRPELPTRLGFKDINGKYRNLVLQEIPKHIIEHDITAFLRFKLAEIRNQHNALSSSDRQLPPEWPGLTRVDALAQMAVPLFIFAATICRFIQDPVWPDPDRQLAKLLEYQPRTQHSEVDKLDATYRPVLDRLLAGCSSKASKRSLLREFRIVVGSIVLLAEPLSIRALAGLLGIHESVVICRIESLHSVLNVPTSPESLIRIFHLSFRDFLVDPDKADEPEKHPFWVDERQSHERLASRCLELLSCHLKKDICNMIMPGTAREDIKASVIDSHLPSELRYACLYWVHHLEQSSTRITDSHPVYSFLTQHFLHWLEALSLLGKVSESISMIKGLQDIISVRYS